MTDPLLPDVVSELALGNAFLGRIIEVCIVTEDCHRTMAGLARLGVGPFRVYTFDDASLTMPTYRGEVSPFSLRVCFATNADLTWEIMQPLGGRTIMREFLDRHGEGIHHLAFDCNGAPWDQRLAAFAERGFGPVQARLPVPPRPRQRHQPGPRQAEEHLRAGGPDPAAPGRDRHPARRPRRKPGRGNRGPAQVTGPADTAALIDQLRADGVVLAYDPGGRTLRAGDAPSVTLGRDVTDVSPRRNKERRTAQGSKEKSTRGGRRLSAGDDRACP